MMKGWAVRQTRDDMFPIEIIIPNIPYEGATIAKKITSDMAHSLATHLLNNVFDSDMGNKTVKEHMEADVSLRDVRHVTKPGGLVLFPSKEETAKSSYITIAVSNDVADTVMNKLLGDT